MTGEVSRRETNVPEKEAPRAPSGGHSRKWLFTGLARWSSVRFHFPGQGLQVPSRGREISFHVSRGGRGRGEEEEEEKR